MRITLRYHILILRLLIGIFSLLSAPFYVSASDRFVSNYPCTDSNRKCISSGKRVVDGFEIYRDCWQWSYNKKCAYQSKDNCGIYDWCYGVGKKECLLYDSLGNCVNQLMEVSCPRLDKIPVERKVVTTELIEKEGPEALVCSGIPCIDGKCFDTSYETNGEMMESLSKLAAFSAMKPDKDKQFNLFAGHSNSCSKKALEYTNCCSLYPKGWGRQLGAKCTPGEKELSEKRQNNLCVYVGKKNHKKARVTVFVKQHYCCFSNILDKVIQVEGRKQLGRGFGTASSPDCSGFSLEDIKAIDFNEVDFSEFIDELQRKFKDNNKSMDAGEISSTVQDSVDDLKKYDGNESNPENNRSGHNEKINQELLEGAEQEL